MQVGLLDAREVGRRLPTLFDKHKTISLAVAWGGMTPAAERLIANKHKFGAVLFGVDFSATDPELITRLADVKNAFVAKSHPGCFHPKIYLFQSGAQAEAIVGSANFTRGGLGQNIEACVHAQGDASDPFFTEVRDQLNGYAHLHFPITKEWAASYELQAKAAARQPRPKNPIFPSDPKSWARITGDLATKSWAQFARDARPDPHHDFDKRMMVLRASQEMFAKVPALRALSGPEWKAIAGVLGEAEAHAAGLADLEWGWFGTMGGAGTFAELIGKRDPEIAAALDMIPRHGDVSEEQFDAYCAAFTGAFAKAPRTARYGPATRLLAMKRPDAFVCVNNMNREGLSEALCFAPTTLSLENYWERVIEPIRQSPWYNADRPSGRDAELWDNRTAMVDAIYYEP